MSLLGVKKAWATPRSVSFRSLIQNFRRASPPFHMQSPPGMYITLGVNLQPRICCVIYLQSPTNWSKLIILY